MNTEVNYVIAKLLKEKGFDLPTKGFYYSEEFKTEDIKFSDNINHNSHISKFSSPTITQVIMWLYEKYNIWISVYTMDKWLPNGNDREQLFDYSLKQMKLGLIDIPKKPEEFSSPTEAYMEAINHTLNNLI